MPGVISWLCIVIAPNCDARNSLAMNGGNFSATHVRQLAKTSERHAAQHLQLRLDGLRGAAARLHARRRAVLARFLALRGVLQGKVAWDRAHGRAHQVVDACSGYTEEYGRGRGRARRGDARFFSLRACVALLLDFSHANAPFSLDFWR